MSTSFSQKTDSNDLKLYKVFGEQELIKLEKSNPGLLELYRSYSEKNKFIFEFSHLFKNSIRLYEVPLREKGKYVDIETFLNDTKSADFNILKYAFLPKQYEQTFQLGDTENYLCIPSQNSLLKN
jgi:hypothetical protein